MKTQVVHGTRQAPRPAAPVPHCGGGGDGVGGDARVADGVTQGHNSWDGTRPVSADDFASLDDAAATGPRGPGDALPKGDFLRPKPTSPLIDLGAFAAEK